jgi:hypothetical protein
MVLGRGPVRGLPPTIQACFTSANRRRVRIRRRLAASAASRQGLMGNGAFLITSPTVLYPPGGGGLTRGVETGRGAEGSSVAGATCGVRGFGRGAGASARRVLLTTGFDSGTSSVAETVCWLPLGASSMLPADAASRSRRNASSTDDCEPHAAVRSARPTLRIGRRDDLRISMTVCSKL